MGKGNILVHPDAVLTGHLYEFVVLSDVVMADVAHPHTLTAKPVRDSESHGGFFA